MSEVTIKDHRGSKSLTLQAQRVHFVGPVLHQERWVAYLFVMQYILQATEILQ